MTTKHYVVTVHLLVELDDEEPGMGICQASACDAISGWLSECLDIKDWGYARTKEPVAPPLSHPSSDDKWALPVEVEIGDAYEEGDLYSLLPNSHRIVPI